MDIIPGLESREALICDDNGSQDDDDDDDDGCLYAYRELYTGVSDSQTIVEDLVRGVLTRVNAQHDWFVATYVDPPNRNVHHGHDTEHEDSVMSRRNKKKDSIAYNDPTPFAAVQ